MTAPSTFKFGLQCGAGGTWVEVTGDVLFEEGNIPITDGRESQFDDIPPGAGSFTLANPVGKYTPGNTATTLAVPLSEGMGVSIELAGQVFAGTIRTVSVLFPPKELANTARVRVTWDDMLGDAARHDIDALSDAVVSASSPYLWWPLDDAVGSVVAAERVSGNYPLAISTSSAGATSTVVFGSTLSAIPVPGTVVALTPDGTGLSAVLARNGFGSYTYGASTVGAWGFWAQPGSSLNLTIAMGSVSFLATIQASSSLASFQASPAGSFVSSAISPQGPHWATITSVTTFVAGFWNFAFTLTVDGVAIGTSTAVSTISTNPLPDSSRGPTQVFIQASVVGDPAPTYASTLVHGITVPNLTSMYRSTEAQRITLTAGAVPEIVLDTLPATLSTAVLGAADGGAALDILDEVIRAEQGYMWVETGGTLLAPTPKIKIAARNRERAIDYTFDVSEILDPIPFIHSLTNTVSQFTANGPTASATYQDATLRPLVASGSSSESSPLRDYNDLYGYASDRVYRGVNRGVNIQWIAIDATSPNINRWTDLGAIRQGHRLHLTGLPIAQLGYNTWDGLVIGREILNTQDSQTDEPKTFFTYYLAPWHPVSVLDTARLASGTSLTLTSNITNSATSFSITSSDGTLFTTTGGEFSQKIRIGNEVMTASAASGTGPTQTITVTRGQTDPVTGLATTAATHSAGDAVEVAEPAVVDY